MQPTYSRKAEVTTQRKRDVVFSGKEIYCLNIARKDQPLGINFRMNIIIFHRKQTFHIRLLVSRNQGLPNSLQIATRP